MVIILILIEGQELEEGRSPDPISNDEGDAAVPHVWTVLNGRLEEVRPDIFRVKFDKTFWPEYVDWIN